MKIQVADKEYNVTEATTEKKKEKGLQGVENLPQDKGMLFDFTNEDGTVSMWMKGTDIPLDIVFINDDLEVISVKEGKPNDTTLITENNVAYVLEVNKDSGIKSGDQVEFIDDDSEPVMRVLAPDGSTQMSLWGNERIFSRQNTKILIRKAKKADQTKEEKDYKALGRYMFKCIKQQDERPPEYVESPK